MWIQTLRHPAVLVLWPITSRAHCLPRVARAQLFSGCLFKIYTEFSLIDKSQAHAMQL